MLADSKPASASTAPRDRIAKLAAGSAISVQAPGKLFSCKEVALAPPGTIVKAEAEQPPKGSQLVQQNPESHKKVATKETQNEMVDGQKPIDEKRPLVSEEETKSFAYEEQKVKETAVMTGNVGCAEGNNVRSEVVEVKPHDRSSDAMKEKKVEAGNITTVEVENTDHLTMSNNSFKGASEIELQENWQAVSPDLDPLSTLAEDSKPW